jgi:amino acid permease
MVQRQMRVIGIYRDRLQSQSKGGDAVVIGVDILTRVLTLTYLVCFGFFFFSILRFRVTYYVTEDHLSLFNTSTYTYVSLAGSTGRLTVWLLQGLDNLFKKLFDADIMQGDENLKALIGVQMLFFRKELMA